MCHFRKHSPPIWRFFPQSRADQNLLEFTSHLTDFSFLKCLLISSGSLWTGIYLTKAIFTAGILIRPQRHAKIKERSYKKNPTLKGLGGRGSETGEKRGKTRSSVSNDCFSHQRSTQLKILWLCPCLSHDHLATQNMESWISSEKPPGLHQEMRSGVSGRPPWESPSMELRAQCLDLPYNTQSILTEEYFLLPILLLECSLLIQAMSKLSTAACRPSK